MSKIYRIDCRPVKENNTWQYVIWGVEGDNKECIMSAMGFNTYESADSFATKMLNEHILLNEDSGSVMVSVKEYKALKAEGNKWLWMWLFTFIILFVCVFYIAIHSIK